MKNTTLLLGAALLSGALAASAHASTSIANYADNHNVARIDMPQPAQVVNPTGLPSRYEGATVTVLLTVDTAGAARDITVVSPRDPELVRAVTKAVAQWRFTPARKSGVPFATRIELPLRLSNPHLLPSLTLGDAAG